MSRLTPVSPKNDFRDTLECSICAQLFNDPKQLNCGHTFCLACTDRMAETTSNSWRKSISCPHCREVTLIPETGLRTNFVVGDLVSKIENLDIIPFSESEECTTCQKVINKSEIAVCQTCSLVHICSLCALKMHKSHNVELLSQIDLQQHKADVEFAISQFSNACKTYVDLIFFYSSSCSTAMKDIGELMLKKFTAFDEILSQLNDPTKMFLEKDLVGFIVHATHINSLFSEIASQSTCFFDKFGNFVTDVKNILEKSEEVNVIEDKKLSDVLKNLSLPTLPPLSSPPQIVEHHSSVQNNTNPFVYDERTPRRLRKKFVKRNNGLN